MQTRTERIQSVHDWEMSTKNQNPQPNTPTTKTTQSNQSPAFPALDSKKLQEMISGHTEDWVLIASQSSVLHYIKQKRQGKKLHRT